ncbi:MAG: hypothetical protein KF718_31490 [Polyangiaceae bacterium]|nr:hypothetical protein [Polyangiaceae bacterium]
MPRTFTFAFTVLAFIPPGCTGYEMDDDEPCRDVGYGISARVFSCTDDHDAANAAYELFQSTYRCNVEALENIKADQGVSATFECSRRIQELTCEQIVAAGHVDVADLELWVNAHPACQAVLIR